MATAEFPPIFLRVGLVVQLGGGGVQVGGLGRGDGACHQDVLCK